MESGIYKINFNGKEYVGSAQNIKRRIASHLSALKRNKHHNKIMQNAFNKHPEVELEYVVLEYVSIENLISKEQEYIDKINPYYNICKIAGNTLGYRHSNEMKEFFSNSRKGKQPSLGRILSKETKDKIASKAVGRPLHPNFKEASIRANTGRKHPDEEIRRVAIAQMKLPISDVEKIRNRVRNGERQGDIAIEYNVSQTVISRACTGKGIYGELFGKPEEIYKPQQQGLEFDE